MILSGGAGKPILGKSGQPIMIPVGVPALPRPPPAPRPLSADQISAAQQAGPAVVTIQRETDAQKVFRLAPNQAAQEVAHGYYVIYPADRTAARKNHRGAVISASQ